MSNEKRWSFDITTNHYIVDSKELLIDGYVYETEKPVELYTITSVVGPEGGGTASGDYTVEAGAMVTVTAEPFDGYEFDGWYEYGVRVSSSAEYTFIVTASRILTAKFAVSLPTYTVTVLIDPQGSGLVTGGGKYKEGQTVTLKATANAGYEFTEWRIDGGSRLPKGYTELEYIQSSGSQYINTGFNPTSETRIVLDAKFGEYKKLAFYGTRSQYDNEGELQDVLFHTGASSIRLDYFGGDYKTLTVDLSERVIVDQNKNVLSVGASSITLKQPSEKKTTPYPMAIFGMNEVGSVGYNSSYMLYSCKIYDSDVLYIDYVPCKNPDGDVGLYDLVSDSFFQNAGAKEFTPGPEVSPGKIIVGDTYTFQATEDVTVTAVFTAVKTVYIVSVLIDPAGAGTVTGGGTFEHGQSCTLTQTTADGYTFSGWYNAAGERIGTGNTYTFTPTENVTITAKYAAIPTYTITVLVDPSGGGTVSGGGTYRQGATVTLKATAEDGYNFSEWKENGQTVYSGETYSFTANANRTLTAAFSEVPSRRLPEGYTEVEYIQSSSAQYIDTGIKPSSTTKIEMDIQPTTNTPNNPKSFFYSVDNSSYYKYAFYIQLLPTIIRGAMGRYSSSVSFTTISSDTSIRRMNIQMDAETKTASVDRTSKTFSSNSLSDLMNNIFLLGDGSSSLPAKLYSCRIYNDGSLLRDFVPCINPSSQVGLYDLVGKSFYENAGTGMFSAGPAV